MSNNIAIYIPNYNGASFLKNVMIPAGISCVVMDNKSTDESEEVCRERGFIFVKNDIFVPRTENWNRCINHFRKSSYHWMKWLFVGDLLKEDAGNVLEYAAQTYPDAAEIIFDYDIKLENGKSCIRKLEDSFVGYCDYRETLQRIVQYGNVFGSPIGIMISQNANFDSVMIDDLEWSEDVSIAMQLTKERWIAYCNQNVGTFSTSSRRYYSTKRKSYISVMEDLEIQRRALNILIKYKSPIECMGKEWTLAKMRLCLEDNSVTFNGIWKLQKSVFRCVAKNILRKIEKNKGDRGNENSNS